MYSNMLFDKFKTDKPVIALKNYVDWVNCFKFDNNEANDEKKKIKLIKEMYLQILNHHYDFECERFNTVLESEKCNSTDASEAVEVTNSC